MIDVQNLTKRYGTHLAVDDVSFRCEPGTITGFLGPNGAGKSTTLRMLMGLTPPSSGRSTIAGSAFADLPNPGRVVGVMLDASAQHVGRSGIEVLRLSAQLLDIPKARAEEVLHAVGLAGAESRLVGNYSLGMRQRLGIANALLGDPEILVLDEPANGMDPEGIRWMRDLLHDFAGRGGTVLLSSHLLGEVQATVDRLVVIGHGKILADDSLEALLQGEGTIVRSADQATLAAALLAAGYAVEPTDGGALQVGASPEDVGRVALSAKTVLLELREGGAGVEDLYFRLTTVPEEELSNA
jgi:ABC-2 type transport system ATP-binding protein